MKKFALVLLFFTISATLCLAQDAYTPYKCAVIDGNASIRPAGCELVLIGRWIGMSGTRYMQACPLAEMSADPYNMAICDAFAIQFLRDGMTVDVHGGIQRQTMHSVACVWMRDIAAMQQALPAVVQDPGFFFNGIAELEATE